MTLGGRIKQLRRQRRLTQRQPVEATGVDFSYPSKIKYECTDHTTSVKMQRDPAHPLEVDEPIFTELANEVPKGFEATARNKDVTRFLRRAAETVKRWEERRGALGYLERRHTAP